MNELDIEKLAQRFHVPVYRTRGTAVGVIMRFPLFYLKIYDGNEQSSYSVQVWNYNECMPSVLAQVRANDLERFVANLRYYNMKYTCVYRGCTVTPNDCEECPHAESCDTYATVSGEHDDDE